MNNPQGYIESKELDKKIIQYFKNQHIDARIATDNEDKFQKFDIIVDNKYIDTKIIGRPKTKLWFEVEKHAQSKANYIWYFLKGTNENYCILKESLLKLTSDNRRRYRPRYDVLVDFSIDELEENKDYERIDIK